MSLRLGIALVTMMVVSFAGRAGAAGTGLDLTTVTPCRLIDTRGTGGPLAPGELRAFSVQGACGVAPWARALVLNVTVVGATAGGTLVLFPAGAAEPSIETVSLATGQTLAKSAMIALSAEGSATIMARNDSTGTVELVLDVSGYFARSGCTPPPAGMAAWWPLDETAGSVAHDLAGGHDGTFVNSPAPIFGAQQQLAFVPRRAEHGHGRRRLLPGTARRGPALPARPHRRGGPGDLASRRGRRVPLGRCSKSA